MVVVTMDVRGNGVARWLELQHMYMCIYIYIYVINIDIRVITLLVPVILTENRNINEMTKIPL